MQAPMSPKFRKHLSDPKNASKLTERIILNGRSNGTITFEIDGKKVNVRQIGVSNK